MATADETIRRENGNKVAQIIQEELIDNPEFRFNHIDYLDWSQDCNIFFPTKHGYDWEDPRRGTHPDKNKSFFFWRDYDDYSTYPGNFPDEARNPEWMISHHRLFVFDGTTNYWVGSTPKYGEILKVDLWENYGWFGDREVPIACIDQDDETPTDRDRRYTYYRTNTCIWGLLDCSCNETGAPCHKVETEYYRNCGFPGHECSDSTDEDEDGYQTSSDSYRTWSLGTNIDNTLGARMTRLGPD